MKVRIPGTNDCTKCRENLLNEYQYEVFANCVDSAACSILCMSIWALEIEGKSEEEIKQFIKDFIFVFRQGVNRNMHNALATCQDNFKLYWGQKLVNTLRALHEVKFDTHREDDN